MNNKNEQQEKLEKIFKYFDYFEGYHKDLSLSYQVLYSYTPTPFKGLLPFNKYLAIGVGGDGIQLWTMQINKKGSKTFSGKSEYKEEAEKAMDTNLKKLYDEKITKGIGEKFFELTEEERINDAEKIKACYGSISGLWYKKEHFFKAILDDYRENGNELTFSKKLCEVMKIVSNFGRNNGSTEKINELIDKMNPLEADITLDVIEKYSPEVSGYIQKFSNKSIER